MRTLSFLAFFLFLLTLTGCTEQRALSIVRRDADRAFDRQQYDAALADYQEVVDRDPNDWQYRMKLADSLMILGKFNLAQEQYAIVNGVRPNDDAVVEKFSEAMFKAGTHDRLMSFLQRRAEDTRNVGDYLRLGWYAVETGDADLAQRALLTAARLDGGRTVEPQLALADFFAAAGDREQALRRLRMALAIDPDNPVVQRKIRAMGEIPGPSFALTPDEG